MNGLDQMNWIRHYLLTKAISSNSVKLLFISICRDQNKNPGSSSLQNCSSSSNFFTKCTVAFQKWKATIHFVKIKKSIFFIRRPHRTNWYLFRKFLSPLISSQNFSLSSSLCSLFSLCSLLFGVFCLKHENFSLSSENFLGFSVVKHDSAWVFWLIRRGLIRRGFSDWFGVGWFGVGFLVAVPDPCRSGGHPRPSLSPGVAVPTGMSFAN